MRKNQWIIVIVLLFQSLTGSTQSNIDTTDILSVWAGPKGSICMTRDKAVELLNAKDSLSHLYRLNDMVEQLLSDIDLVTTSSKKTIDNLLEQKLELGNKIVVMEKQLEVKNTRSNLFELEVSTCQNALDNANKQIRKQKTGMIVTSTVAGISIVGIIVSILIIAL